MSQVGSGSASSRCTYRPGRRLLLGSLLVCLGIALACGLRQGASKVQPDVTSTAADARPAAVSPENVCQLLKGCLRAFPSQPPALNDAYLRRLRGLPPGEKGLVRDLTAFLDSGVDSPTGLPFAPSPDGFLQTAPSLRVFALDWLGAVNAASAAEYSRRVLSAGHSPDEWAVALRCLAKALGREQARKDAEFPVRVEQLLTRREWLLDPGAGFLHSFDAAVWLGGDRMAILLAAAHGGNYGPGVKYASALALDRMAQREYSTVANVIIHSPADSEPDRLAAALIIARANPQSGAEMALAEAWLLSPATGAGERARFFQEFPNGNGVISHNLLTRDVPPSLDELARRDGAALSFAARWRADERFAQHRSDLAALEEKLNAFRRDYSSGR